MTLKKHVIDTMKEWQMKIGRFDSDLRLYYPKGSLCDYLNLDREMENEALAQAVKQYFAEEAEVLGEIHIEPGQARFCILVGKEGCAYVEQNVPEPEFLTKFLEALKSQKMSKVCECFEIYGQKYGTKVCRESEKDDGGTLFYFEDENVDPYRYCVDENEFGITYHRFTKSDYENT
ncbi:MAG: DUF3877 family protein [Lachnospiraceae bacterium]|nr:DUF3877 family protein [Lachnospiraceae bacterium]